MKVSLCTELCGLQQKHAEMRRYGTRKKPENVILKQQDCQQRSRGMFTNCCHECTRGRVGNNERRLPVSPQGLFGWHGSLYSKTSNNGPSEKRTTSLQRTAHLPPIDFTIELIHYEPPRSGHLSTPNNGH